MKAETSVRSLQASVAIRKLIDVGRKGNRPPWCWDSRPASGGYGKTHLLHSACTLAPDLFNISWCQWSSQGRPVHLIDAQETQLSDGLNYIDGLRRASQRPQARWGEIKTFT